VATSDLTRPEIVMMPKGSPGHSSAMNTTDIGRERRSRATRRLRNLTIGTAAFGIVATGGLSALAAATYHGTLGLVETSAVTASNAGSGATTSPVASPSPAAPVLSVTQGISVIGSGGTSHATTGGS
jgi:hypothetical protein